MTFNHVELASLLKMGLAMANADGRAEDVEMAAIAHELLKFGVDGNRFTNLASTAENTKDVQAIATLSGMNQENKKYATVFLAVIMAANGEIDDKELALWKLVCTLCDFPTMTVIDALKFWKDKY